jgi:hypothetical protein
MTNVVYKPIILLKNTIKYIIYLYFTLFLNIRGVRKVIDEKEKLSIAIRNATVTITGVIDNPSTGNPCEAVTVPPTN